METEPRSYKPHAGTHRLLSSSSLWFIFRILQVSPKKELLRSLWVALQIFGAPLRVLLMWVPRYIGGPKKGSEFRELPMYYVNRPCKPKP